MGTERTVLYLQVETVQALAGYGLRHASRVPSRSAAADHLLRRAIVETFRGRLAGLDLRPLQERFDEGLTVTTGDAVPAQELLDQLGPVPVLAALLERLEPDGVGEGPTAVGVAASVLEFALEGLYLNRRLAKDSDGARTIYGS